MKTIDYISVGILMVLIRADVRPYWVSRVHWLYDSIRDVNKQFYQTEIFGYDF